VARGRARRACPWIFFFFFFFVFYLINRGGQQNASKNTSIYRDLPSEVFWLPASVNPKCPPRKRFSVVVKVMCNAKPVGN
jgi:hypothetical protein